MIETKHRKGKLRIKGRETNVDKNVQQVQKVMSGII